MVVATMVVNLVFPPILGLDILEVLRRHMVMIGRDEPLVELGFGTLELLHRRAGALFTVRGRRARVRRV